jgi:protoporphyrinogen oxidase
MTNTFRIPLFARLRLVTSFIRRPKFTTPANYLEWTKKNFGKFYTHNFAEFYTRKYWQEELVDLSVDWAGARVYAPTLLEVLTGFFERTKKLSSKASQHYFSEFHYPKQGGFENLFKALEPHENFDLDSEIVQVNLGEKYVVTKRGVKHEFDHAFNSIPIPDFLHLVMDDLPEAITQAASKLRCTSLTLVDLVFNSAPFVDCHWAYVYDLKYNSTRFHFPQLFSGGFDALKRYAIQVEVYDPQISSLSDTEITELISKEIVDLGVFSGTPIGSQVKRLKYANVVFDHNHDQAIAEIRGFLSQHNVSLMGRYGNWDYSWSDDAIESGRQSALEYLEMEKN